MIKIGKVKKKKHAGKRKKQSKSSLKKTLSVFYAVNAVLLGVLLLYMGVSVAGQYTERNIDGSFPDLVYLEDIMKFPFG